MSNGEPAGAARSIFHFLYVDSNLKNWCELDAAFNPPDLPERHLLERYWKEKRIHQKYDILFSYAPNFKEAIYSVVNHNIDDVYLVMGRRYPFDRPFNGILFELKTGASPEKYKWDHFLQDLSDLGLKRLKLNDGFMAIGKRFNDEIREILMRHNVRKIIKYKNFSVEQIKAEILDYFALIDGPGPWEVERHISYDDRGRVDHVDRVVVFEGRGRGSRRLHLPRIEVDEEARSSHLSPPPDNDDFSVFDADPP